MLVIIFKDGHKETFDVDEIERVVIERPFKEPNTLVWTLNDEEETNENN